MVEKHLEIKGMTCTACAIAIEKSVGKLDGIEEVSVNFATEKMKIRYSEDILSETKIADQVRSTGYDVAEEQKNEPGKTIKDNVKKHEESMKKRFIISLIFTIPIFYLAMGEMAGLPLPGFLSGSENSLILALVQMLLTIPVMITGAEFYKVGFRTLWKRSPNMDSLIAIGSSAAFLFGVFVIFQLAYGFSYGSAEIIAKYSKELYFESAAVILTLITLGKYFEARAKGRTSEAIKSLLALVPDEAVIMKDGAEIVVPLDQIKIGDIAVVRPGGKIPADGIVTEGYTAIDESMLTGESLPTEKKIGDNVTGGSINKTGFIKFRINRTGEDTTLAQIVRLVEDAQGNKAPIARTADKISAIFVPIVIGISLLSFLIWMVFGYGFAFSFTIAVSVLVISCPCALGLATPTAIMVGTGKGAQYGILIKSGEALETIHKAEKIVFDKTGTLTIGKPVVTDILSVSLEENKILGLAAAAEKMSEHPLSDAIVSEAVNRKLKIPVASDFEAIPGFGIRAVINDKTVYIGKKGFMDDNNFQTENISDRADSLADEGKTPLYVAYGKEFIGIIAVADIAKEGSLNAVNRLISMGYEVIMLTGDNKKTAEAIGRSMGIENVISNVLPKNKAENIKRLQKNGAKVVMVGDGINDSVALVQADVGIAMGNGTDVAIESADVVLMKDDLGDVVTALELSSRTIRNIKQNLFWAFFYNILGIPIAAGILYISIGLKLNPMIAAAAMSFSSVSVVLNALRLKRFRPSNDRKHKIEKGIINSSDHNKKRRNDEIMKKTITIEGMTCMHCAGRVKEALESVSGVISAEVNLENNSALISFVEDVSNEKINGTISEAGYKVLGIV